MNSRTRWGLIVALILLILMGGLASVLHRITLKETPYTWSFPIMGTVAKFVFYAPDSERAEKARVVALQEFKKVEKLCNLYDIDSELSQLNRAKKSFTCSPDLWELLLKSRQAYLLSQGNFDVSIKPLMDLWGFYRRQHGVPDSLTIKKTLKHVGLDKIQFIPEKRTIVFTVPGMALDLGGIAKGYALDKAAAAVVNVGITSGILDLGGNLRFLPNLPVGKSSYRVGIRDPRTPGGTLPEIFELPPNCAVSTSGDYERFVTINGAKYGHIISPKSGIPPAKAPVTVIAKSAIDSDWLSTAIYLGGPRLGKQLKEQKQTGIIDFIIIKR